MFEDIDKAPSDVQSILLPLLEGSSSFSVGHAEVCRGAILNIIYTKYTFLGAMWLLKTQACIYKFTLVPLTGGSSNAGCGSF